ncbi:MAG: UbiX family flavin prenyltransferase [Candidatus Helarchaeota archaeon]
MKLVIAITGASGAIYAKNLIDYVKEKVEIHLVISKPAEIILKQELNITKDYFTDKIKKLYTPDDIGALTASSSFKADAYIVVPCSLKTLGCIANGISLNLITRTCEVALKENRKLIIVIRETPLSLIALENMLKLKKAGAIILPAMPGFYHSPQTIDDVANFIVGKILDQLGVEHEFIRYEPTK